MKNNQRAELIVCDDWYEGPELTEDNGSIIPIKIPKEVRKRIKDILRKEHKNKKHLEKRRKTK